MSDSRNTPPAGWLPDPNARHELRYWDGAQWTDHVSNVGQASRDAYDPDVVPPPPPSGALVVTPQALDGELVAPEAVARPVESVPQPAGAGGTPVSSADVLADEAMVWEGGTQNMTAVASKGKVVNARYRLTTHALYIDKGVMSSNADRIVLAAVIDVSAKQSVLQKRRGVGNVVVRFTGSAGHPGYRELDSVQDPMAIRDLIIQHATRERQRASRGSRTFYQG